MHFLSVMSSLNRFRCNGVKAERQTSASLYRSGVKKARIYGTGALQQRGCRASRCIAESGGKSGGIELNILEISYLAQRFSGTLEECVRKLNRLAVNDKTVLDENYTGKGLVKLHDTVYP